MEKCIVSKHLTQESTVEWSFIGQLLCIWIGFLNYGMAHILDQIIIYIREQSCAL